MKIKKLGKWILDHKSQLIIGAGGMVLGTVCYKIGLNQFNEKYRAALEECVGTTGYSIVDVAVHMLEDNRELYENVLVDHDTVVEMICDLYDESGSGDAIVDSFMKRLK